MNRGHGAAATLLVCSLAAAAALAQDAGTPVAFVACPILRNTELPCWLGESGGELYYLGPQGDLTADFYPPEFGHKMLVEGVVASAPKICGGVVLKPVRVSVLPDQDINCNIMLPAAGFADPPHNRGSGPSGVRGAVPPPPPPRTLPVEFTAPFKPQVFTATFNADSERLWNPAQNAIATAARYANATVASRIEITGYRAAIHLSNGQDYVESQALAASRAAAVEQALRTVGVPAGTKLSVRAHLAAIASQGMEASLAARRVTILVVP